MKIKIIKIGNSRGIRLPKEVLRQIGIENEIDLQVEGDKIISKPIRSTRNGWREAFKEMSAKSDDKLLVENETIFQSSWDEDEWEWKNE